MPSTKRLLAALPAAALLGAALSAPSAQAASVANYEPAAADFYINYAPPQVERDREQPRPTDRQSRSLTPAQKFDRKFSSGNPATGRILAARERQAVKTGRNPAEWIFKDAKQTRTAKLLTLLVEFNEQANDDFSGFNRLRTVNSEPDDCVVEPPGTLMNGPLHNQIPDPATLPAKDNNSFWVKDFSPEHFNKMLYSDRGITERVRPDLTDPRDGRRGIDISGFTMKKMYEEMSKGAYSVTGSAVGWIKVPHSEAWYGAAACGGAPQDMSGHPGNALGPQQLAIDSVDALAKAQPDFPWADYDLEDISDADGDGNHQEPDGVIDHLVLVHAGKDKSSDGGAQGTYAIWAHSSAVAGGYTVPGTDKKISNYIVQPEDSGVGVFAHEYGHDLGLPDLYDTSGQASSAVDFWDLMSSGSHSGPIFQSMPTHMGLWDKWVLGWANPQTFDPGDAAKVVTVGQSSRTPKFTADGVRVNLASTPEKMIDVHSGSNAWWTGLDQDWANLSLTRDVAVPAGTDVRFWMWNNYVIEQDWDFGFVEVSADGGRTWTQRKVFNEAGEEVSTPDGYPDPNKNLKAFGNKKYGLTGSSDGWRHDYVDLTPFAGQTVKLRLAFNTDAAFQERGWHADDFELTNGGTVVWSDDVEGGTNGWIPVGGTFTNTSGQGWTRNNGEREISRFYLAEWRNFDGFDQGLQYAYDTDYLRDGAWKVQKLKYNAPGLLVWYRDSTHVNNNVAGTIQTSSPSLGPKGSLLIVDSHFEPLRRTGVAAEKDPTVQKNLQGRVQTSNAAFGFVKTYPFKECVEAADEPFSEYCTDVPAQNGVKDFTDAKTWFPGIEVIGGSLFFRDADASVVVPSKGDQPYTTRVVNQDGTPATELYGQTVRGSVLGTGNPGDEGKALGVQFKLISPLPGNLGAVVQVVPPKN